MTGSNKFYFALADSILFVFLSGINMQFMADVSLLLGDHLGLQAL